MSLPKPLNTQNDENNKPLKQKRIGLFGGTFDPIHLGHIEPLSQAAKLLNLSSIQLIPANIPPHKAQTYSSSYHRAEMVKLICQSQALLTFDDRELKREKPSYTLDTLNELHQEHAHTNTKTKLTLFFFIGMDSLVDLPTWHRWQDILQICHLVVMPRPNYEIADIDESLVEKCIFLSQATATDFSKNSGNIYIMPDILNAISSTEIRAQIKLNKPVKQWLANDVHEYILNQGLYR